MPKVSELTASSTLNAADMLPIVQNGTTKRTTAGTLYPSYNAKWSGAIGDGTTNDRAAFATVDALGSFVIPSGTYKISSNITLSNIVIFLPGAKLSIDSGVTVTFSSEIFAPEFSQIFYGSGTVAGLKKCYVAWFAGDKTGTTTDALTEIQKAYDACVSGADIKWVEGSLCITGATSVLVSKGQKTKGVGKFSSRLHYTTAACNGFLVTTALGATFHDIGIGQVNYQIKPTSGTAFRVETGYVEVDEFLVVGGYIGIQCVTGGNTFKASRFDVLDCWQIGINNQGAIDNQFSQFTVVAIFDRITLSGVTGSFTTADVLIGGTSGALGQVGEVLSPTLLRVHASTINYTVGETVTGSVSGATATVVSQEVPHNLGGIRLADLSEAIIFTDGDVIGGKYPITTDATSNTQGNRPAYDKFTNVYFDSADNPAYFDKAVEFDFTACWFSNRPSHGLQLETVDGFRFNGGGAINCYRHGALVNAGAKNVHFGGGFRASGNSQESAGTYHGIVFAEGCTDFRVQGATLGGTLGFGTQGWGCIVVTGASDRYIVADNVGGSTGNSLGVVSDGGTGVNKRVANNY